MGNKAADEFWNESIEDVGLELARVALSNGYAVMLADRRLTRATRYHGLRLPGWRDWWWADEVSEILAKVRESEYATLVVIGVERNNLVATWELRIGPDRGKSTVEEW